APVPGLLVPANAAPAGPGAAILSEAPDRGPALAASAAAGALGLRDQALAALDEAGLRDGADEAALLVAVAEIEEAMGRFDDARATITAATALLSDTG